LLNINLFSHLDLSWQGQPLLLPASSRNTPLLAYLLLNRRNPLRRDTLAYTLWFDSNEAAARANLRRSLHQLRAILPSAQDWLLTTAATVQWNVDSDYQLDVAEFERLAANPARLAEAVALYRGDLLADSEAEWLFYERERLRSTYEASLERLVADNRRQRNYAAASHFASQLLAHDPLHEQMTRQLMAVHYEAGDRAAALATYAQFAAHLSDELAAAPMIETTALHEAILADVPLPTFAAPRLPPTAGPSPAGLPFVGRADELEQLVAGWRQAAAGGGTLYFVGGEAGVGKSRLCTELSAVVAAQGGWVLHGGTADGEARPYQAIAETLREALPLLRASTVEPATLRAVLPLLPELASTQITPLPPLEPERERGRLYQAVGDCLRVLAARRPLLLLLEDMHWAGQASINLLHYVAERLAGSAVLVIVTYREEEVLRDHPLRKLRREVGMNNQQLALERLSAAAVSDLVARLPGQPVSDELATAWYSTSEGNPFFLGELIYGWLDGEQAADLLPDRVQMLLARRIVPLPVNTRLVAEVASVIGTSFSPELVGEAAGLSEGQVLTALDQLMAQRLVREGADGSHSFSHHLIGATVYAGIDPASRQRRHRRIGLLLAEGEGEPQAAGIAAHLAAGGEGESAAGWYLQAARAAQAVYADDEALAAACAATLTTSPRLRFDALALRETILHRLGRRGEQEIVLGQMTAVVEELTDDDLICEVLRRRILLCDVTDQPKQQAELIANLLARAQRSGDLHWQAIGLEGQARYEENAGRFEQAQAYSEQAIALYQQLADHEGEVRCLCRQSSIATFQGHFNDVNRLLEQAQTLATAVDQSMIVEILRLAALNFAMRDDSTSSYQLYSQMLTLSRAIHDRQAEATAQGMLALNSASLSLPDQTFAHAAAAQALYEEVGDQGGLAMLHGVLGALHEEMGRHQDALAAMEQTRIIYSGLGHGHDRAQAGCLVNLSAYAAEAEQYEQAKEYAEAGLELARAANNSFLDAYLLNRLGIAELHLGEKMVAVEHLQSSITLCRRSDPLVAQLIIPSLTYLALAHLQLGEHEAAAQTSAELLIMYQHHPDQASLPHHCYWAVACVERAVGNQVLAGQYLLTSQHELRQQQVAIAEKLGEWADEQWRSSFVNLPLNRAIIAAYQRDEWPAYAQPPGLIEPSLPLCPACGRNRAVTRAGQATAGGQRYRCTDCQRYFTVERKVKGYDPALHSRAHDLHEQGWSSRQIARELGVSHVAVSKWLKTDPI